MTEKLNISVIGTGNVGRTIVKELIDLDIAMHIDIQDPAPEIDAIKQDLRHATSFAKLVTISWNEFKLNEADYIFICAAEQATTIGDRLAKAEGHVNMMYDLFKNYKAKDNARLIVVTNPVDVITYHAWKASGLDQHCVIGTGTYLESLRFEYYLSQLFETSIDKISGMLLGEHGNSAVTAHSKTFINKQPGSETKVEEAAVLAINAPYKIRTAGEYTKYAISKCAVGIFKAIHLKQDRRLPAGLILNEKNCALLNCQPICFSTEVRFSNGTFTQGDLSKCSASEIEKLKDGARILEEHTLAYNNK
jgi:L-lactate dehydrogenase